MIAVPTLRSMPAPQMFRSSFFGRTAKSSVWTIRHWDGEAHSNLLFHLFETHQALLSRQLKLIDPLLALLSRQVLLIESAQSKLFRQFQFRGRVRFQWSGQFQLVDSLRNQLPVQFKLCILIILSCELFLMIHI